jgi:hypothetical protein
MQLTSPVHDNGRTQTGETSDPAEYSQKADDDEVDRDDIVQQSRDYEDQNAGDQ